MDWYWQASAKRNKQKYWQNNEDESIQTVFERVKIQTILDLNQSVFAERKVTYLWKAGLRCACCRGWETG